MSTFTKTLAFQNSLIKARSINPGANTYPGAKIPQGNVNFTRLPRDSISQLSGDYSNYRVDLASFTEETVDT